MPTSKPRSATKPRRSSKPRPRSNPLPRPSSAKRGQPSTRDALLDRMRQICLALPDTKETLTWGKPHFRVADKIFCGCDDEDGRPVIGFKLEMAHAHAIVKDPRFWKAPYVGHKGWVSMDLSAVADWGEVRALVAESYRLIAPKKSLAKLLGAAADLPEPRAKATVKRRPSRLR